MGYRFNPPPNWPPPPPGFVPPPRWQPDPAWPPPPPGWQLWVPDDAVPGGPDDFATGPVGIRARPPDFAAGPAAPPRFPPGLAGPADHPGWAGDVTVAPDDFATGAGDFAAGSGDFGTGPIGHRTGPLAAQPPPGPPTEYYQGGPYGPRGTSGRTNGFAIAAFVLGLIGAVLLSVIFGIIALRQIPRRGQRGRGLAIAGLAVSGGWVVLLVGLAVLVGLPTHPAKPSVSDASPSPSTSHAPGTTNVFSLRTGECFQNPPASQTVLGVTYVTVVPCTTPHNAQVFVQFAAVGSSYPGGSALKRQADQGCHVRITANVQKSKITSTMTLRYLYPLPTSWAGGHRTITCLIVDAKPDLKSSLLRAPAKH